jgi:sirohydrochlorin cobaltochelatase
MPDRGIVLFAHGARDARWAEPFEELRRRVQSRRPDLTVSLAFLEHMAPDLAQAVRELADQGVTRARIVPLFFGRGGHLRDDFPHHIARARAAAPNVMLDVTTAAGEDPRVIDTLADFALADLN